MPGIGRSLSNFRPPWYTSGKAELSNFLGTIERFRTTSYRACLVNRIIPFRFVQRFPVRHITNTTSEGSNRPNNACHPLETTSQHLTRSCNETHLFKKRSAPPTAPSAAPEFCQPCEIPSHSCRFYGAQIDRHLAVRNDQYADRSMDL